jgi:hypothetical protein
MCDENAPCLLVPDRNCSQLATFICNLLQANKYSPSLPDRATARYCANDPKWRLIKRTG